MRFGVRLPGACSAVSRRQWWPRPPRARPCRGPCCVARSRRGPAPPVTPRAPTAARDTVHDTPAPAPARSLTRCAAVVVATPSPLFQESPDGVYLCMRDHLAFSLDQVNVLSSATPLTPATPAQPPTQAPKPHQRSKPSAVSCACASALRRRFVFSGGRVCRAVGPPAGKYAPGPAAAAAAPRVAPPSHAARFDSRRLLTTGQPAVRPH